MLFEKGKSGNPAGRPPGSGFVGEQRKRLQSKLPEVVDALISNALAGDATALKLYLERVMPALKPEHMPVTINAPEQARLSELGHIVVQAIAKGEISPDQGAAILSGLASQAKLVEVTELEQRIAALEQSNVKQT